MANDKSISDRFWSKVDRQDPESCWLWLSTRSPFGYGSFWWNKRMRGAHRFSWEFHNGPIPVGLYVCHRCDNPPCVNPDHLFLGTHDDNMADKAIKGRASSMPGEQHPTSKLTERDVFEIMAATESAPEIARRFRITSANVMRIRRRETWKHLGLEPAPALPDGRAIPQNYAHIDRSAERLAAWQRQKAAPHA